MLADHFLRVCSKKFGLPLHKLDPGTVTRLQEHVWPGSVRELEHAIESAIIMSRDEVIRSHHLPERLNRALGKAAEIDGHSFDGFFDKQLANFKLKLAQS